MSEDFFERRIRDGFLLDCYGGQLTEKQLEACRMIMLEDLSFGEAAERLGVSRQNVYDLMARSRKKLETSEKALKIVSKKRKLDGLIALIDKYKDKLPSDFYEESLKIVSEE